MFRDRYKREMETVGPSGEQLARLTGLLEEGEERPMKRTISRTALAAAVMCAVLAVTAGAAAVMGVFEHLKEQDNFVQLGMTEVYEEYAYDVNKSVTTGSGDVFTVEKVATDGVFCTIFYSYRYAEPVMGREEFEAMDTGEPWAAYGKAPYLDIIWNGEEISEEGYQNSFEVQQYYADEYTVYGAWRSLLNDTIADEHGEVELELRGYTYDSEAKTQQDFALSFPFRPNEAVRNEPDVEFSIHCGGRNMEIKVESLHRSPLGSLLTLRYQRNMDSRLGIINAFVLRDGDTGKYIPFARIWTRDNSGGKGDVKDTYELFGDMSGVETLELIPIWSTKSVSEKKTVALSDLPSTDSGNAAGGYAPASYQVKDGRIIVELQPVGAVSATEATIGNGVYFLDKDGNKVFQSGVSTEKIKDRTTGTIQVVSTVEDPEDFARNVDKVTALWFFVEDYTLLEEKTVTIPVPTEK